MSWFRYLGVVLAGAILGGSLVGCDIINAGAEDGYEYSWRPPENQDRYERNKRVASRWDGTCPIEFDKSGFRQFPGPELEMDENGLLNPESLYNQIDSAARIGDRRAIKCMIIFHSLDDIGNYPQIVYEYLWLAYHFGVGIPAEHMADIERQVPTEYLPHLKTEALGDAREAAYFIAQEYSEAQATADMGGAYAGQAFLDDIDAEVKRLKRRLMSEAAE